MFLIHFDPGARGDFLYEWLTDDVSTSFMSKNSKHKIHQLYLGENCREHVNEISDLKILFQNTSKLKIRINSLGSIPQVMYNTFLKNDLEARTIEYFYSAGITVYNYNRAIFEIIDLYDIVIPYSLITNVQSLCNLYKIINHKLPTNENIEKCKLSISLQQDWTYCTNQHILTHLKN